MLHLACDVHTHTIASRHAYSTVEENVYAAAKQGFELLGVADHFSSMIYPQSPVGVDMRDYQQFINFSVWPEVWHGVRLLHGCEADIVDLDGHLYGWDMPLEYGMVAPTSDPAPTLQEMVFGRCDYVIASVHGKQWAEGATREQITRMYVRALEQPEVLILGHVGRSGLDFDVDEVCAAARDLGKMIEINDSSLYGHYSFIERCRYIAERCAAIGCMVAVSSDAHISYDVARLDHARMLLEGISFPESLIATRDAKAFLHAWEHAGM